jgi:hypothetical protein
MLARNPNRINTFSGINWKDPFPDSDKSQKTASKLTKKKLEKASINDFVYDAKKFNKEAPPTCVFIPSAGIMRKIMRVCSEIKTINELFYIF